MDKFSFLIRQSAQETKLLNSVVGCFVNLSSCKETMVCYINFVNFVAPYWKTTFDFEKVLSGFEEIQRLLPKMIETLMKSRDQKLVQLLMMLMFNLLCTDFQYKVSFVLIFREIIPKKLYDIQDVDLFTREDLDNLKKVAVRWSRGERGRKSLIDVATKLEACLEEGPLGTAEQ